MMKNIAIIGFGSVGQTLTRRIQEDVEFGKMFRIYSIWNRTSSIFEEQTISKGIRIHTRLEDLIADLSSVDLVIECAHSSILERYGINIIKHSNLFVSSPTVFANDAFRIDFEKELAKGQYNCFVPLGASVGLWDIIRLDEAHLLKSLTISMSKDPSSFKITEEKASSKILKAIQLSTKEKVAEGSVRSLNIIAPQNTNTMSVYAMAARQLGFDKCKGRLIADPQLKSHLVECSIETTTGLSYSLVRDNPAQKGAVTGSATFGSFFTSLKNHDEGIRHGLYTFC